LQVPSIYEKIVADIVEIYKLNLTPEAFNHYSEHAVFLDTMRNCVGKDEIKAEKVALKRIISTTCSKWELATVLLQSIRTN
jgi:hypothetical protein